MNEPIVPREIRRIYQGRIFSVQVETLTLPNGTRVHRRNRQAPGVGRHHSRHGRRRDHPCPAIPPCDRPVRVGVACWKPETHGRRASSAARRECQEEVGLVPSQLTALGSFFPTPGYCDEEMNFYRADGLRQPHADETARPDDDEDIEARPFSTGGPPPDDCDRRDNRPEDRGRAWRYWNGRGLRDAPDKGRPTCY